VKSDWLYVQAGDFGDSSPHDWENKVMVNTGGEDLIAFENVGIISSNEEEVVYKAEATFGFELTAHTYVGYKDVYPNIDLEVPYKSTFFCYEKQSTYPTKYYYYVKYNEIELGSMREHIYEGVVPVSVGIKDIVPTKGSITLNGETFSVPQYVPEVKQVNVQMVRDGIVGEYTDDFINVVGIEEGNVRLEIFKDDLGSIPQAVVDKVNSFNLGWTAGQITRGQTYQQLIVSGSQAGATFHNPNPAEDKELTFNLNMVLQPEVYEYSQYNDIRYGHIQYDDWFLWQGTINVVSGPISKTTPKRIVAVHTDNPYLHYDFTVKVDFYATIPSTAELTEAILDDPYLKAGDFVWDTSFTGDYNVSVQLSTFDIFGGWGWLILIVIIAIIIIALYIVYKVYFGRKKQVIQIFKAKGGKS